MEIDKFAMKNKTLQMVSRKSLIFNHFMAMADVL